MSESMSEAPYTPCPISVQPPVTPALTFLPIITITAWLPKWSRPVARVDLGRAAEVAAEDVHRREGDGVRRACSAASASITAWMPGTPRLLPSWSVWSNHSS